MSIGRPGNKEIIFIDSQPEPNQAKPTQSLCPLL